jgi:hypothetical protein
MTDQVKLSTLKPGDRFEFNCAIWEVDNNEDEGWVGVHALGDMKMGEDTLVVQVIEVTFTEAQEALIREALKGRLSNQEILQKMGLKP